jgi:ABC-2 type transport system ATP-binding protein
LDILRTIELTKSYETKKALDNININIPPQSIYGLLGPNGAGKTTLIRIITQIFKADSGQVFFNDELLNQKHILGIGYMPEERGLYKKMKVGEQLLYLAQLKGLKRDDALSRLKSWFIRLDIKEWWNKNVEDLSKGMQQKVQFIATVLHQPSLIILDEPFSGFDPINANLVKDEIMKLRDQGSTIIFSTHRMESVEEMCDYIALINNSKKILDGKTKQVRSQYRSNTFVIETELFLPPLPDQFEILKVESKPDHPVKTTIKIKEGFHSNDLLQLLIQQTQIVSLNELIPTINDIFIKKVMETNG